MVEAEKIEKVLIPNWEEKTIARLKEYPDIVNRLATLEIEIEREVYPSEDVASHISETGIFYLNGLGKVSECEVEYREKFFEKRIIDEAINRLEVDLKEVIIEKYIKRHDKTLICDTLHIMPRTYERRNKRGISIIADLLGMKYTFSDMA